MPAEATDIDSYVRRIGYTGSREPTLETLRGIVLAHTTTIPFENLTPFLHQPVRLDIPSLFEKLVHSGRGGYCFEQNLLLRHVLLTLGYKVTGLAARVRWNVPDEVVTPRSHMVLRVDLDGEPFIVDAGFGGLTLTGALRLIPGLEQPTSHEPFRLVEHGAGYLLQAQIQQEWKALYSFELQEQHLPDYEVSNWYASSHPQSPFVTGLMLARPDGGRRYALRNNQLSIHHLHGETERHILATAAELRTVLAGSFHIQLPDSPELDQRLESLLS